MDQLITSKINSKVSFVQRQDALLFLFDLPRNGCPIFLSMERPFRV